MAIADEIIPIELNLDLSPLYLGNRRASFVRNMDYTEYGKDGKTAMVWKPLQSTRRFDPDFKLPPGKNKVNGALVSRETNEVYVWVWNENPKLQSIYRIRNGKCQFVFIGDLKLRNKSRYFVSTGRAVVVPINVEGQQRTYLSWLNGWNEQCFLCVEDSIATNYFDSTRFPRFRGRYDRSELIALGLREPEDCIEIREVADPDSTKINKLKGTPWQFRLSYIDAYGRQSEHGVISDLYYQSDCSSSRALCVDLTFDAGGPLVEQWRVEFRRGCAGEWSKAETLAKYEDCDKPWYERSINKTLTYHATTNRITYRFCADKECTPVSPDEAKRPHNPMPITSESLFFMAGCLGLGGNKHRRKPFSCDVLDKVKFTVEKPEKVQEGIQTRNITVWVQIWNPYNNTTQAIYKNPQGGRIIWGGVGPGGREEDGVQTKYGQYFADEKQENFIGCLRGHPAAVIGKQYRFEDGTVFGLNPPSAEEEKWIEHGVAKDRHEVRRYHWMQKFEFKNVKPGRYIFQIASHHARMEDKHYQQTSTFVAGQATIHPDKRMDNDRGNEVRELVVDVCEKDYDTFKDIHFLKIWDLTEPHNDVNFARETKVLCGYAWEAMDDENGVIPIEGAPVDTTAGDGVRMVRTTDHNGFYFVSFKDNRAKRANVAVRRKCKWEELGFNERGGASTWNVFEGFNTPNTLGVYTKHFNAKAKWPDYMKEKCNRTIIRGKVLRCGSTIGVPNVSVVLAGGQATVTNERGEYELVAHYGENRNLYFTPASTCSLTACDDKPCLPIRTYTFSPPCVDCSEIVFTVPTLEAKFIDDLRRGPQLGGRYPLGLKGADWMGRKNFIQTKPAYYIDIPTTNELGGFGYPRVKWQIDRSVRFPSWMKRLYFNWGKNLKYSDFHSWVVDRFEFVDNSGNVNEVTPSQIRIYYPSLNEYNKQHSFATNSTWQVIDEKDSLRITDTVQFIANGDGTIFPTVITERVRFDKEGNYFQIDYNANLRDLKEGALIKLMRETDCEEAEFFSELCQSIAINDGVPEAYEGYLNIYDSYYVGRSIPTPIVEVVEKTENGEVKKESVSRNILKNYGWPFEHHSPSDKWGNKCANRGRVGVKDEYEGEVVAEDQVALSGVIGTNSIANYLHYFDEKRFKDFKLKKGMLVAALPRDNQLLVVLENYSFTVPFDDDTVRMGENGVARVNSGAQQFGKPQNTSLFGCSLSDRNTVAFDGKVASWLDTRSVAHVYHNFQQAVDVSKEKYESFLRRKIKFMQSREDRYFHQHINPKNEQCYLTDFGEEDGYTNTANEPQATRNETFCVDLGSLTLRKFTSFTPEYYASLTGDGEDKQLFSFKDGLPYTHYAAQPATFNTFYGVKCPWYKQVASSLEPSKVKDYLAQEVHIDNVKLYAPRVRTQFGQQSWIPRNMFERGEKLWVAPFVCDEKTHPDPNLGKVVLDNVLYEGDLMRGTWMEVLLAGDPETLDTYFELTSILVFVNGVEKTGKQ